MFDVERPQAMFRASRGWGTLQLLLEVESVVHPTTFGLRSTQAV